MVKCKFNTKAYSHFKVCENLFENLQKNDHIHQTQPFTRLVIKMYLLSLNIAIFHLKQRNFVSATQWTQLILKRSKKISELASFPKMPDGS